MADNLKDILDIARREAPDVPEEAWGRIERALRLDFGGQRPYIAAQKKRAHLEALAAASSNLDAARLAAKLGISVRHMRRIKKLSNGQ